MKSYGNETTDSSIDIPIFKYHVSLNHRFVSLEQAFVTIRKFYINHEILSDINILYNLLNSLK